MEFELEQSYFQFTKLAINETLYQYNLTKQTKQQTIFNK